MSLICSGQFFSMADDQYTGCVTTLGPLGQSKLESSALNQKGALKIHLLNLNYAKTDDSQPTFSVFIFTFGQNTINEAKPHVFNQK